MSIFKTFCKAAKFNWPFWFQKNFLLVLFCFISFLGLSQDPPKTISLTVDNGLLQTTVWAIEEDNDHRIWIGTPGGIQIYDGFQLKSLPEIEGTLLRLQKHDGFIYAITISALYKFDMQSFAFEKTDFSQSYFYLTTFLENGIALQDDKGSLIYYYGYDLKIREEIPKRPEINAETLFSFSLQNNRFLGGVNGIGMEDSLFSSIYCKQYVLYDSNTAFVASHKGLLKIHFEEEKWHSQLFFSDIRTTHLLVDHNKNLWVASGDDGIFMIHRNSLKSQFFPKIDLDGSPINCWSLSEHGGVLYTHTTNGMIPVERENWKENELFQNTKDLSTLNSVKGDGFYLIGTRSDGIYRMRDGKAQQIHFNKEVQVDNIIVNLQKTKTGFLASSKYSFIQMDLKGDVVSQTITDFDEVFGYSMEFLQKSGEIINSRTTGLAVLDSSLNLKHNYHGDSIQVVSMMRSYKNELWGVSMDAGLLKLDQSKLVKMPFPDKHLFTLSNWKDENLWISGIGAIYKYSNSLIRPFESMNGFPLKEYNQSAVYKNEKDFLYYSGVGGIVKFHPDSLRFFPNKPKIIIEHDGQRIDQNEAKQLSFDKAQIILDLNIVSISDQNYFKMEIRMNGEWMEIDHPKQVSFSLPYGDSKLQVRIKDLVHRTQTIEDYSFFRALAFWEKWWFKVGLLILSILLIVGIFSFIGFLKSKRQNKLNQIRIEEQQKGLSAIIQAQEEERKRIAKDLHDGIVQQLGGLKLGLQKIFTDIETEESQKVMAVLDVSTEELRALSHKMMPRSLSELGLIPAISDMLDNSLGNTKIKYQFEHFGIKDRMKEAVEIAIYRISQELVNNVIKHSNANKVSIQLFKNSNDIILIVEDNGRGMLQSDQKEGIGLMNIASRLDSLKGKVNFAPSPESGTLATIRIPLQK